MSVALNRRNCWVLANVGIGTILILQPAFLNDWKKTLSYNPVSQVVNYYYRQFEILADISKWNNMEMEFISISCQILCKRNYNQQIPVESSSQLLNIHSH